MGLDVTIVSPDHEELGWWSLGNCRPYAETMGLTSTLYPIADNNHTPTLVVAREILCGLGSTGVLDNLQKKVEYGLLSPRLIRRLGEIVAECLTYPDATVYFGY